MSDLLATLTAAGCVGQLIGPDHLEYDRSRKVWNGVADRRPAAILRAADVEDVRKAIGAAAGCGALLAVRGGGHSLPGLSTCDGGLLLDLSGLAAVQLDESAGTVEVGGGALLGDLDRATVSRGYVVPAGVISHTGVAGLTLGGGMGWTSRRFGLSIDNLLGVEIVTADGSVRWVDDSTDGELFWGIRGGGGNFGVVTRFRFKLSRLGAVTAGRWIYPRSESRTGLVALREVARDRPREFALAFSLTSSELTVTALWSGEPRLAAEMLEPFGRLAGPGQGQFGAIPFVQLQSRNDEHVAWSRRYYAKGGFWPDISDESVESMIAGTGGAPSPDAEVYVLQLGGAIADVAEDATAYSGRQAGYYWIAQPIWDDAADDERCIAWGRAVAGKLADSTIQANYVNEQGDIAIASSAYGAAKYARLQELKARLDPTNLFRLNQNIKPSPLPR